MGQTALIDLSVLAASMLFAVIFAYRVYGHRRTRVTVSMLASLSLGPATTFVHMWAHMFAIGLVNIMRYQRGEFEYNIRFYALLQLGIVMLLLSGLSLHVIRRWAGGHAALMRPLVGMALLQMLFSFPLYPFTPIGTLPGLGAGLLLLVLYFSRQQIQRLQEAQRAYALA
jgi:hypothetical protein